MMLYKHIYGGKIHIGKGHTELRTFDATGRQLSFTIQPKNYFLCGHQRNWNYQRYEPVGELNKKQLCKNCLRIYGNILL